jgi:hypothetical protein
LEGLNAVSHLEIVGSFEAISGGDDFILLSGKQKVKLKMQMKSRTSFDETRQF